MSSRLSSLPHYRTPPSSTSKRISVWDIIASYAQPSVPALANPRPKYTLAPPLAVSQSRDAARGHVESEVRYPPNAWSEVEWELRRYSGGGEEKSASGEGERRIVNGVEEKGFARAEERKATTVFERLQELEKASGEKRVLEVGRSETKKTIPWTSLLGALPTFLLLTSVVLLLLVLLSPTFLHEDLGLLTLHLNPNTTLILGPLGSCHLTSSTTSCTPASLAPSSLTPLSSSLPLSSPLYPSSLPLSSPLYPISLLLTLLLLTLSTLLLTLTSFPRRHSTPHTTRRLALAAGGSLLLGLGLGVVGTLLQRVALNKFVGKGLEGLEGLEGVEGVEIGKAFAVLWSALGLAAVAGVGLVGLSSGRKEEQGGWEGVGVE